MSASVLTSSIGLISASAQAQKVHNAPLLSQMQVRPPYQAIDTPSPSMDLSQGGGGFKVQTSRLDPKLPKPWF